MLLTASVLLFVAAFLYVVWPLLVSRPVLAGAAESLEEDLILQKKEALEAEKNQIYAHIKDLEFEHAMGKIGDDEFHGIREQYKQRVVPVIREMDYLNNLESRLEADIESAVGRLRSGGAVSLPVDAAGPSRKPCPSCNGMNEPSNRFCGHCGASLCESRQL